MVSYKAYHPCTLTTLLQSNLSRSDTGMVICTCPLPHSLQSCSACLKAVPELDALISVWSLESSISPQLPQRPWFQRSEVGPGAGVLESTSQCPEVQSEPCARAASVMLSCWAYYKTGCGFCASKRRPCALVITRRHPLLLPRTSQALREDTTVTCYTPTSDEVK